MKIIPDGCGGYLSLEQIVEIVNSRPYYNIKEDDLRRLIESDTALPIARSTINILGTEYTIDILPRSEDKALENMDGYCDDSVKRIAVADVSTDEKRADQKRDIKAVKKKVLRHEITHAFLCESGLAENSDWAQNEELVDWIAIQGPKLIKAWQEVGAL